MRRFSPSSRRDLLIAAAVIGVIVFIALLPWRDLSTTGAGVDDPELVALGKQVYDANCAVCHGPDGTGHPNWRTPNADGTLNPPPHDSSGHTWHHGDGFIYRMVREGGAFNETPDYVSVMPAFGQRLDAEEVHAVIVYLKSLWSPEERAYQEAMTLNERRH
jgi:mono/diheme cytochrome c family protein